MYSKMKTNKGIKYAILVAALVLTASTVLATLADFNKDDSIATGGNTSSDISINVNVSRDDFTDLDADGMSEENSLSLAHGVYIDGVFVGACLTESEINDALNDAVKAKADALNATGEISLLNDVVYSLGEYESVSILTEEELAETLGVTTSGYSFNSTAPDGTTIDLLLSYQAIITTDVTLEYPTLYCDNDARTSSYSKTLQKGIDGLATEVYSISYVNGQAVSRELIDTVTISDPQTKIVERGVKIGSSKTPMSLCIFEPPIQGLVTSDYGWRVVFGEVNFHYGLDYADHHVKGRPVTAGAAGEVIYSQWNRSGYGYRVEILHSNGMITTYSHLSSLAVEVGDIVDTGDVLGIIGTTGKSTGIHVHFEVIIDGVKVDPELYVRPSPSV